MMLLQSTASTRISCPQLFDECDIFWEDIDGTGIIPLIPIRELNTYHLYNRNKISALKSSSPSDIAKAKAMLYQRFQAQDADLAFIAIQFFVYADPLRPLDQKTEFHNCGLRS